MGSNPTCETVNNIRGVLEQRPQPKIFLDNHLACLGHWIAQGVRKLYLQEAFGDEVMFLCYINTYIYIDAAARFQRLEVIT
jgi:hypothetical protein